MPTKKILLVANSAWNLWNYRRALVHALEAAGHTVVLAAPDDRFSPLLPQPFRPLRHLSRRSLSPLQNARAILELRHLFLREQPDLALLFTIKPNILGNWAARWAGTPTLSVIEGLGHSGASPARWRWVAAPLYRWALRHARRVVFLNRDDAEAFVADRIVRPEQAAVVPGPGIDTEHFQPMPPVYAQPGRVVFLFCGRLLADKGVREFVEAAERVRAVRPDAVFRILGGPDPGNPSSLSPETWRAWSQSNTVEWIGTADDVRPHLAAADVLVLPTYYREGMPRSVLEALAMGKIAVTTDTPGCRDTVEHGKNGLLVPPRRADVLVETLLHLLDLSAEARRAMGAYGRAKVVREFSDAVVLPRLVVLVADAAARVAPA